MAHLTRGVAAASMSLLVASSCHGASEMGIVDLELYDTAARCSGTECFDDEGRAVEPASVRSWAFVSTQTTRHHPRGRYLHFQVRDPEGPVGHVELDVPEDPSLGAPEITYVERVGEEVVFEAHHADGFIQLPLDPMGAECTCVDTRFDLVFTDAGTDGAIGTDDDDVRRLSNARVTLGSDFCVTPEERPVEAGRLDVEVVDRCREGPGRLGDAPPEHEPPTPRYTDTTSSSGCSSTDDSYDYDSGGGCDCSHESSGGGCDDGSGSSGCGGGGGGCEGDTSSSGSGCSGDTSGGGSGCSGDTGGGSCADATSDDAIDEARHASATRSRARCRLPRTIGGGPAQTPVLVALVLGVHLWWRRRDD